MSGLVAAVVLVTAGWRVISRHRLRRLPGQPMQVRRVRVQSGLLTRSWLELDSPPRWIPVHFDPVLVTLPALTSVQLHGDPQRRALVAAEVDDTWLHPCAFARSSMVSRHRARLRGYYSVAAIMGGRWAVGGIH